MSSNLYEIINRANRMANLIKRQATGTRTECAGKMGISERSLDNLIAQLRQLGAPIAFCRFRRTYYFEQEVDINFGVYPNNTCDEDKPCTQELPKDSDAKASGCSSDEENYVNDKKYKRKWGGVKFSSSVLYGKGDAVCYCVAV